MHAVEISARDGLVLPSYLSLPRDADPDGDGKPAQPLPMVLYVHGGPWARDSYGYNSTHQWLANRGYAVLSVNYRGSSGFGKSFIEKATHEFAGKMHDDLIDAVNWTIDKGIARKDRIAIMGGSYGGYATLVGMTFTPATFACGVDIVGPSNLVTLIESFPAYWQPFLEMSWYKRVGDPRTPAGKQLLLERSPLTRVDKIQKPLLIGQGANDPRVTRKESDQIVTAMKARDIPVTYVVYADEGHGFARPENRISFYAITDSFLGTCLGGRTEPLGDDLKGAAIEVPAGVEGIPGLKAALPAK
jgi:dipeptidyl aminopeptidase/acylaminoacyl peptidase